MPSSPLDGKHVQTTLGVACHHRLRTAHTIGRRRAWHAIIAFWAAQTVERRPPWHAIIAFGLAHTVGRRWAWHAIIAFGQNTWSNDVRRCMPSPPLDCMHGRPTSGVTCHHRLWAAHSIERCLLWHVIIAVGQHTRLNDVGRGMPSWPLDTTHGRTKMSVAFHHSP